MRTMKALSLGFTRLPSPLLRYFRRHRMTALGSLVIGGSLMSLGASFVQNNRPDPATACADLANLTTFPAPPTQPTRAGGTPSAPTTPTGVPFPHHRKCKVITKELIAMGGFPLGDGSDRPPPPPPD